ncbi:hypothetical protein Y88_2225 [Novosphingobium nitrogenifigens DSM 19370]|uniref:Uncharacterized protein n=1 Tax=Novosphingobium nitrogenifigens DSM 19370 TaxID=983920 RepID=F1Z5H4_9SPHN|nr:hypothetical protein Y88_2225 [Novosphingobium nitrogenifigens DSM 19370]
MPERYSQDNLFYGTKRKEMRGFSADPADFATAVPPWRMLAAD